MCSLGFGDSFAQPFGKSKRFSTSRRARQNQTVDVVAISHQIGTGDKTTHAVSQHNCRQGTVGLLHQLVQRVHIANQVKIAVFFGKIAQFFITFHRSAMTDVVVTINDKALLAKVASKCIIAIYTLDSAEPTVYYTVTIPHLTQAAANQLLTNYPGGSMTKE